MRQDPRSHGPDPYVDIELCFDADTRYLPLVRSVAAETALQVSGDLDYVDRVRQAADEAVATLMTVARDDATVCCLFRLLDCAIRLSVSVPSSDGVPAAAAAPHARVMHRLVDRASTIAIPRADGSCEIRSDLVIAQDA